MLPLLAAAAASQVIYYTPQELMKIRICAGLFCVGMLLVIYIRYKKYRRDLDYQNLQKKYSDALEFREKLVLDKMQESVGVSREDAEKMVPMVEPSTELTNRPPDTTTRTSILIIALVVIVGGIAAMLL